MDEKRQARENFQRYVVEYLDTLQGTYDVANNAIKMVFQPLLDAAQNIPDMNASDQEWEKSTAAYKAAAIQTRENLQNYVKNLAEVARRFVDADKSEEMSAAVALAARPALDKLSNMINNL